MNLIIFVSNMSQIILNGNIFLKIAFHTYIHRATRPNIHLQYRNLYSLRPHLIEPTEHETKEIKVFPCVFYIRMSHLETRNVIS